MNDARKVVLVTGPPRELRCDMPLHSHLALSEHGAARQSAADRHAAIAAAAKRRLAAQLDAPNRIPEIAAELGVSQFHLAHVFQKQTGLSIHRYLQRLRMATALVRLHDGEESLSRLALDLGFSSHSHFTAVFRQHFGKSPSAVRAATLAAVRSECQ